MRVLIVDDSKMMRVMHARSLRQAGFQVEVAEAGDGEEALRLFEPGAFDLVILDWNMPGMDGIEFVKAAREKEQAGGKARAPFLMVTSQSTDEQMVRAKDAGVDSLLTKPVTPEALAAAIEMLLAGKV